MPRGASEEFANGVVRSADSHAFTYRNLILRRALICREISGNWTMAEQAPSRKPKPQASLFE